MSYPNLVEATEPQPVVVTSEIPSTYTPGQQFQINPSNLVEVNANGDLTAVPLGHSGPFIVDVNGEKILVGFVTPQGLATVYVYGDVNGRGWLDTDLAEHVAGSAATITETSAQENSGGGGSGVNLTGVGDPRNGNPTTPTFLGQTYQDLATGQSGTGSWTAALVDPDAEDGLSSNSWVAGAIAVNTEAGGLVVGNGYAVLSSPGDGATLELNDAGQDVADPVLVEDINSVNHFKHNSNGDPNNQLQAVVVGDTCHDSATPAEWMAVATGTAAQSDSSSTPDLPLTITEGVNDQFVPNGPSTGTATIAPGVYADLESLLTAVQNAIDGSEQLFQAQPAEGSIIFKATWAGSQQNSWTIAEGNGALAALGFDSPPITFSGGTDTVWEQIGPNLITELTYNSVALPPLPVLDTGSFFGEGSGIFMVSLTTGPGLITGLQDATGNPIPDGWKFPAVVYVADETIQDIVAITPYGFGSLGQGGVISWGPSGGLPTAAFGPTGIFLPSIPTSDPAIAGALWSNLGIVTVSAG